MKRLVAVTALLLTSSLAFANPACEAKALDKNGKPLHGAAKTVFMKKCETDAKGPAANSACEDKAIDKNGKPLHGAAKGAFMKKCNAEANAAKK